MKLTKDQELFDKFFTGLKLENRYWFMKDYKDKTEEGYNVKIKSKECVDNQKFEDFETDNVKCYCATNYTENKSVMVRVTFKRD